MPIHGPKDLTSGSCLMADVFLFAEK